LHGLQQSAVWNLDWIPAFAGMTGGECANLPEIAHIKPPAAVGTLHEMIGFAFGLPSERFADDFSASNAMFVVIVH
jgi:hypothetical protein